MPKELPEETLKQIRDWLVRNEVHLERAVRIDRWHSEVTCPDGACLLQDEVKRLRELVGLDEEEDGEQAGG